MEIRDFGILPFPAARKLQEECRRALHSGLGPEVLLVGEHPPTVSLGLRSQVSDLFNPPNQWQARGYEVCQTDRAGGTTLHLPGQLVFYPVVSLRQRHLGVRSFVLLGLQVLADFATKLGLRVVARENPAGVWLQDLTGEYKLASVGLRFRQGISDHGFSFNACCALEDFAHLIICRNQDFQMSSLHAALGQQCPPLDLVRANLAKEWAERFG